MRAVGEGRARPVSSARCSRNISRLARVVSTTQSCNCEKGVGLFKNMSAPVSRHMWIAVSLANDVQTISAG